MNEPTPATLPLFHIVILGVFLGLNATLLFLFLMHLPFGYEPLRLVVLGWAQASPRIDIVFALSLFLAVGGYFALQRLPAPWKTRLLFFRRQYAHPAHEAFFSLKEPPFDRKPLLAAYPEVKDAAYHPEVQFSTWRRLCDRHAEVPLVTASIAVWELLRDLYLAELLFLFAFLLSWPLNQNVNQALAFSYLFLFGVQALFLLFTARGTGRRLVYNVLAVELGIAGQSGIDKAAARKAAKADKRKKRF